MFSSYSNKYYLITTYPRKRKYRFSFLNKKSRFNPLVRHPLFKQREKPKARLTYIQYNAHVRKHNEG